MFLKMSGVKCESLLDYTVLGQKCVRPNARATYLYKVKMRPIFNPILQHQHEVFWS
jgi:hypothetical protein